MAKLVCILIVALSLEAVGVVFLSKGLKEIPGVQHYNFAEIWRVVCHVAGNGHFWLGLLLETVFFVLLLVLLHNWDVSLIWPLTALGFVLTTLSAKFINHEDISALRWGGVILIVSGAILVGYSEKAKKPANPPVAANPQS
jgi:multidrug transporter EmrE-like cation transporter